MTTKRWGTGSRQDDLLPEDDPNRPVPYEAGPTGAAAGSSELRGDPDEGDVEAGAEAGAMGGAVAGTAMAGPLGGLVGAGLGGIAGAGSGAADDDTAGETPRAPGGEPKPPFGREVEVERGTGEHPHANDPTES